MTIDDIVNNINYNDPNGEWIKEILLNVKPLRKNAELSEEELSNIYALVFGTCLDNLKDFYEGEYTEYWGVHPTYP